MADNYVNLPLEGGGGPGSGVSSVNSLTGAITLLGGVGISITPSGNTLTFANTYLPGISDLTGDGTATGPGSAALTLATVNANVGSFGTTSSVSTFTVNAKGLITAASDAAIQIAESQVTNLVSDLAGKQATGNYITALTGDVTATGPGSAATTIANLAVTNAKIANSTIDLTTKVTGLLPVANGGTGASSAAQNLVFASPNGSTGAPAFRALVSSDLPLTGATGAFVNGGNTFGTAATLGTNGLNTLAFKTNNVVAMTIDTTGYVGIGTPTPSVPLDVSGNGFIGSVFVGTSYPSGIRARLTATEGLVLRNNFKVGWTSASLVGVSTSPDVSLIRSAAGLLEINDNTPGSYADLQLRALNPTSGNVGIGGTATSSKLEVFNGNIAAGTAGNGFRVKEGSNAKMGVSTLVAGTVTVSNTSVTANSRIFLTSQSDGGTPGFVRVSTRTAATSFVITSSSATDTSVIAWQIIEPA